MRSTMSKKVRRRRPLNINQTIALVFAAIILVGTGLLCLPFSTVGEKPASFLTALFTATSATCVTGLVTEETGVFWSGFGKAVILCLVEVGGLGFMSIASFFIFALRKKMNMNHRMVMAQSIAVDDMSDAVRLQKRMLFISIMIQLAGAVALTIRFFAGGEKFITSLKYGLFHSVSAFCNAGFDVFGNGNSVMNYATDPAIVTVLSFLVISGGLGYVVWDEILSRRSPKKWSVYTRLVLITTAVLLFGGALLFCVAEWNNPETIGNMTAFEKITAGFFQSVTTRTAGFDGIGQGNLTSGSFAATIFLMLIGGSSGSTAGGLKTVTFVVIVLFLWSRMRGKKTVCVSGRTIPDKQVMNALTIFGIMVLLSCLGATVLSLDSAVNFSDALYESISAIATVGLTTGITPGLGVISKLLLIVYMYFGRVGVLTISLGFLGDKPNEQKYRYAETNLLIG